MHRVLFAAGIALLLCASGCSDDKKPAPPAKSEPGSASQKPADERVIASQPIWIDGRGTFDLLALDRTANDTITARFRVTKTGSPFRVASMFARPGTSKIDLGGLALIDGANGKRYATLRDSTGKCVCTDLPAQGEPKSGEPATYYAVFPAVPAALTQITLSTPATPPFLDVPLGDRSGEQPDEKVNLAGMSLLPPDVLPLISTVESEDEAVDEGDETRSVRLSSDVLFALNSADLSSAADRILTPLAKDIDGTTATTVKIDGYTDTSGNDAINNPLSERRAKSVQQRLTALITRQGISFQVAGHGSKNPVVSNGTEHGRRLNRRVTVSYPKPPEKVEPAPAASPPANSAGPVGNLRLQDPKLRGDEQLKLLDYKIVSVNRDSAGTVALTWSVTNNSKRAYQPGNWSDEAYVISYYGLPQTGVTLVDPAARRTYLPLKDTKKHCVCSTPDVSLSFGLGSVQPQETVLYYVLYKVPADVKSLVVQIKGFAPSAPVTL